ncbi:hypothetical protein I552_3946 [Mycobacterium xenopi 3993]|nr:hypothetical protein I552_3946 [Mycobacterium xenopi 3993]
MYFLQTGPASPAVVWPADNALAPRVLYFAENYEPDNGSGDGT